MSDDLVSREAYSLTQPEKEAVLFAQLRDLTDSHYQRCPPYQKILDGIWPAWRDAQRLEELPYLPVSLFKTNLLTSVPPERVRMTMTSSGTTGAVSKIQIDDVTANLQARALSSTIAAAYGRKRAPMLIIDTPAVLKDRQLMSARGAGVLGMMKFGRNHAFALDENMQVNLPEIERFLDLYGGEPFYMFGFTFMVWLYLVESLGSRRLNMENGVLIHSGGWKKLLDRAVDNESFRDRLSAQLNLVNIYNFYGMVEQMGSIFLEGPDGGLTAPNCTTVVIRDPVTFQPLPVGETGLIQVLSILPNSYPGHSLLTEDLGYIHSVDRAENKRGGQAIKVVGRLPRMELRGCSDVYADQLAERAGAAA